MLNNTKCLLIFISHLYFSSFCCSKLIENESFLRSLRNLKTITTNDDILLKISNQSNGNEKLLPLIVKKTVSINNNNNNNTNLRNNTINTNSTLKERIIKRKVDHHFIPESLKNKNFYQNSNLYQTKNQNLNNNHGGRSENYINYRQAYGIRFDPNKIRRSFNYKNNSTTENEHDINVNDNYGVNNISNDKNEENIAVQIQSQYYEADNMNKNNELTEVQQETTTQLSHDQIHLSETNLSSEIFNTLEIQTTESTIPIQLDSTNQQTIISSLDPNPLIYSPSFPSPQIVTAADIANNEEESISNLTIHIDDNNRTTTNIMKPMKIQTALDYFNHRVKELFSLGGSKQKFTGTTEQQRFLNLFNVIKFDNVPCASQKEPLTPLNGTCYHQFECDKLGGVAVDECASGFGVCCVFQFGCGGITRQNISYFKSPDFPAATTSRLICTLTVDLWSSVTQVLIEFIFFELKPPIHGSCTDDQFIISGQSLNSPTPILCGINSGQHLYVDVENSPERKLYLSILAGTVADRAFNIRVSQLQSNVAPKGCLQYYTDTSDFIQTFNYDDVSEIVQTRNPQYLNNLNYAICIQRAPNYCLITYTNVVDEDVYPYQLLNVDIDGANVIPAGQAGAEIFNCGDDFIVFNGIRLCGERFNDGSITEDYTANAPVTDFSAGPIIIPVRTNSGIVGRGFKLRYYQLLCQSE